MITGSWRALARFARTRNAVTTLAGASAGAEGEFMKRLTLEPDEHMRWIYDYTHPDYNSLKARDLRERRRVAMRNAPQWMIEEARLNDALGKKNRST